MAGVTKGDQALISVLLLSGETVSVERIAGLYKIYLNVRGNALIFDYKTKTLVRSYPISAALFDASD